MTRRGVAGLAVIASVWAAGFAPMTAHAAPAVEDTMAQRMQACTGCHGPQGRAASDGYYPRIAGKPAGYLYNQLRGFREARRHYALMNNLLAPLSDAYLREIANHFAGLEVAYPAPVPSNADAATKARGEALVRHGDAALKLPACMQCHGQALMGVAPSIPALIGMPRDYLNAQLGAWRTGKRQASAPDCMAQIAQRLGTQDTDAISQWLSSQAVPAGAKPALALPQPMPVACGGLDSWPASTPASASPAPRP